MAEEKDGRVEIREARPEDLDAIVVLLDQLGDATTLHGPIERTSVRQTFQASPLGRSSHPSNPPVSITSGGRIRKTQSLSDLSIHRMESSLMSSASMVGMIRRVSASKKEIS